MRTSTANHAYKKPCFDLSCARGFYEQKLISDQITQLTGRRFVGQHTSIEEQTRALMDNSVGAAQQLKLSTGIALSKEQAAALTQDIVWLVEERITLADGSSTTALVPRVYLSAQHAKDLTPDGALIAADTIDINSTDLVDNSGTLKSTTASMIAARDILNTGNITSSGDLLLSASRDLSNISGSIAGRRVSLTAGNNLLNSTASMSFTSGTRAMGGDTTLIGALGSITALDSLSLDAMNNLTILGANISSGGNAQLKAGNQLTIGTLATESGAHSGIGASYETRQLTQLTSSIQSGNTLSLNSGGDMRLTAVTLDAGKNASLMSGGNLTLDTAKNFLSHNIQAGRNIDNAYDETVLGTNLKAGGNITLAATNAGKGEEGSGKGNLTLLSANITSDTGRLNIIADNTINIGTTDEKHTSLVQTYSESSGFMSSSSSLSRTATSQTYAVGSTLSADSINIKAGKSEGGREKSNSQSGDINITGSSIAATNDVMLDAGNNLNILAATSTNTFSSYSHTTESGFMSNGGLSISFGDRESTDKYDSNNTQQSQNRSMVGSINGNLTLKAGGNTLISGSDILAGQDINVLASDITINSGLDQSTNTQSHDSKQSGLTLAVGSSAIAAAQTVQQMKQLGGQTKDKRTQALAAATTALAVANAASSGLNVSASLTYGSSESHSDSTQTSSQTSGSTVKAGGNLNLVATAGKGEEGSGNITIQGSDIKAGNNISLAADNTINLFADKSTASQVSHSTSSSSGVGVGASFGTNGAAVGVTANAAASRGNADGNDVTYTNTHLDAGNQLSIKSGGDTNLKGAVANGKQIIADIGGNLNIESLQDTSVYASANTSMSGSVTAGIGFSASGSYSQSNINGNYASVQEQSGLKSGDGGFQIAVKGNTDLKGAVIESSQAAIDAGNNSLITASLISSDIQNRSEYDAESLGVGGGFSVGGSDTGKSGQSAPASTGNSVRMQSFNDGGNASLPIVMSAGENTTSTTKSGISGASITITDEAKQKQLTGQSAQETIASLNREVSTGQDTSGAIGNNLDVNEVQASMAVTQVFVQQASTFVANQAQKGDAAKAALKEELTKPEDQRDPAKIASLTQAVDDSAKWGMGGAYRQIATALTAAAGGNVTSGTSQLVQGAAVNYIQSLGVKEIKQFADNLHSETARVALQSIAACAGAAAQGSDCGAAALGASSAVLLSNLMAPTEGMTSTQKQQRENIVSSLVAGIAAATDGNAAAATTGAQIELENNSEFSRMRDTIAISIKVAAERSKTFYDQNNPPTKAEVLSVMKDLSTQMHRTDLNLDEQQGLKAQWQEIYALGQSHQLLDAKSLPPEMLMLAPDAQAMSGGGNAPGAGRLGSAVSPTGPMLPRTQSGFVPVVKGAVTSEGSANAATLPLLKGQLMDENLARIAAQDTRLASAVNGSGTSNPNFSIGNGSVAEASRLGKAWVGDGAKPTSDGGWISADGTRAYRPPTEKSSSFATTGVQANFETYTINSVTGKRVITANGHLNITN